jgi:hypothetical protein
MRFSEAEAAFGARFVGDEVSSTVILEAANATITHAEKTFRTRGDALAEVLNRIFGKYPKAEGDKKRKHACERAVKKLFRDKHLALRRTKKSTAKYPPLTDAERSLAKQLNGWWHQRKQFQLPSDTAGNWYTKKNVGDLADQYLRERHGLVFIDGSSAERDELVAIMYRYRAEKAAETRHVSKKRRLRAIAKRLNALGEQLKRKQKERKAQQKREETERQGTFDFARSRP